MTKAWAHYLYLFLLLLPAQALLENSMAQDVTVRLVDVRNGHVFANETINMQFHVPQVPQLQTLESTTGSDGTAKFRLAAPLPPDIAVFPTNTQLYSCSRAVGIDTKKIIDEGLISRCSKPTQGCRCKFSRQVSEIRSRPGELVLLARPVTNWEKFLSHIWE
jgi:hypothetical protein